MSTEEFEESEALDEIVFNNFLQTISVTIMIINNDEKEEK